MNDRLIGRAGFLGVVAAGIGGLFLGQDAVRLAERALPAGVRGALPSHR